ncbi:MAG: ELM1/GtrOC1 family putative glycosyltransferase [Planctomycetota bacterium]
MLGATHRITREELSEHAMALGPMIDALPKPRTAVLIGGAAARRAVTADAGSRLVSALSARLADGGGLMITTSRRTPPDIASALKAFAMRDDVYFFDAEGASGRNPYFGMLGAADRIIVTEDSVNMAVEAAATGAPVEIVPWGDERSNRRPDKFDDFHDALARSGAARPFSARARDWTYEPLDETGRAADAVLARWGAD